MWIIESFLNLHTKPRIVLRIDDASLRWRDEKRDRVVFTVDDNFGSSSHMRQHCGKVTNCLRLRNVDHGHKKIIPPLDWDVCSMSIRFISKLASLSKKDNFDNFGINALRKLLEETHVARVEMADVADAVLDHGDAFDSHAEGKATDLFRVICIVRRV